VIKDLYGVIPVLSTPMDANGSLDLKILEKEIRWVKSHKIHSIATGMVSEILRMDKEERKTLTQSVCDIAKELSMNAVVRGVNASHYLFSSSCRKSWCYSGHDKPANQH